MAERARKVTGRKYVDVSRPDPPKQQSANSYTKQHAPEGSIKTGTDSMRLSNMLYYADDLECKANALLDLLSCLELKAPKPEQVITWACNVEAFRADVLRHEVEACNVSGYLRDVIEKEAMAKVKALDVEQYSGDRSVIPYVDYDKKAGRFVVDRAGIEEHCGIYLTGAKAEAWKDLQQATELLNNVFHGIVPYNFHRIWDVRGDRLELGDELPLTGAFQMWTEGK